MCKKTIPKYGWPGSALTPIGIPYHCRCMVAGRLLAGHKTLKNDLHTLQFVTADRSVSLGYSAYDEMGSRLAVLE